MRVALVHPLVGGPGLGGGGSRLVLELGLALQDDGHDVVVACHDFHPGTEFGNASERLEVRSVRSGPFHVARGRRAALRSFWSEMPRVARLVPADADVVNAHEWPALHAGWLASMHARAPLVWTRNDNTIFERAVAPGVRSNAKVDIARRLTRAAVAFPDFTEARRARAIVTLDERSADLVRRAYRREAHVVRRGPSDQFFDPPDRAAARRGMGLGDDDFLALGLAILVPHRRFEDLIAAADIAEVPGLRVSVVGSDHGDRAYADRLSAMVSTSRLGDRISLNRTGVSEDELRAAYAAADAFVFPSDHLQSWGLAPLEALASGTPVVITEGAGVHEVLAGRPGVSVVPEHDPPAIARALEGLARRRGREVTEPTRAWLARELSSRSYARRMAEIYGEVAARH